MAKAQVKAKVVPITPPTLAATPGAKSVRTAMMLGMLSIGMWTGRIGAKDIAHKLEQDAGAKNGTMTTSKKLMNGKAEHEAIGKYATECRNWWATVTVPWFDNGMRGYNAGRHMELMVEIGDRRRTYFGLVEDFMAAYPNLRAQAAFDMGELFNEDEFPSPGDVRKRFRFDFDHTTVPNAADIRIIDGSKLTDSEKAAMQTEIEERTTAKVQAGMKHAAEQLAEVVRKMHGKLSVKIGDSGHIFRNSLIENIAQLVEIMPGLNITDDPALAALVKDAKRLALYSPDELREDETKRTKAATEAKALAAKLGGLFSD